MNKQFEFKKLNLSDTVLITPFCAEDFRGKVKKNYSKEAFREHGIDFEPVEELEITSKKNVIRGLHFQRIEGQAKLIRVIKGKIIAIVLDIDYNSDTFGKHVSLELTNDRKELFVPKTCAFGSLALEDSVLSCQCGSKFIAEYSDGILWNDKEIAIDWKLDKIDGNLILAEKDKNLQSLREYKEHEI